MIDISHISFRYPGADRTILNDVTIAISRRDVVAIMGANGSGKSTLARCINGLLLPDSGSVTVEGLSTGDPEAMSAIRRVVGMVFQDPGSQMTSSTVERELAFGLQSACVERTDMLRRVEDALTGFGLAAVREIAPGRLSGGQQQMVALAAVLILEPRYLVLDEPTAFLSDRARRAMLSRILDLHRRSGTSLILITQDPDEALLANRLLILDGGRIVFDDLPARVFRHWADLAAMGVSSPLRARLLHRT